MKTIYLCFSLILAPAIMQGQLFKNDTTGARTLGISGLTKGGNKDTTSTVAFAYDAVSSRAASAASTTHQWAHTCTGTNVKGALLIGISVSACSGDIASCTVNWGSGGSQQAATQINVSKNTAACLQVFLFKVMNPHIGTDNIYVTLSVSKSISSGAVSYKGVGSVSAATMANATSATATVTVSSAVGRTVIGAAVAGSNQSFTPGSGVTERYDVRETVSNKPGAMGTKDGAASVVFSMSLDAGADDWAIIAAELIP